MRKLIQRIMIPDNQKWARIARAFYIVYTVAILPIYFIGMSEVWAARIVYYVWKTTPAGIVYAGIPYNCGRFTDILVLCSTEKSSDIPYEIPFGFHFIAFTAFFLGGFITVRLFILCLDAAERGLGVDFLLRTIDKFLPPGRTPSISAAESPVSIEAKVDVVELVKEVASWVRGVVSHGDESERQRVANSVPRLVTLLTSLADQKIAFSEQIENHLVEKPGQRIVPPTAYMLEDRVRRMNKTLEETQGALNNLDPQWGAKHVKESVLGEYLPRAKAADMATAFRAEAEKLLETAREMSNTLKQLSG